MERLTADLRSGTEKQNDLSKELARKEEALKIICERAKEAEVRAGRHASSRFQLVATYIGSFISLKKARADNGRLQNDLESAKADIRILEEEIDDRALYEDYLHGEHQNTVNLLHEEIDELRDQILKCEKEISGLKRQYTLLSESFEEVQKERDDAIRERDELKEKLHLAEIERDVAVEQGNDLRMRLEHAMNLVKNFYTGIVSFFSGLTK